MAGLFGENNEHDSNKNSAYYQQQEEQEGLFSQRTMAKMRDTQAQYEDAQASMSVDLARNSGDDPDQMLALLKEMKDNQKSMNTLASKIESDVSDFDEHDYNDMRERRKKGQTDAQIAKSYGTNTSFVNRKINGK